jgi:hypothetical protein
VLFSLNPEAGGYVLLRNVGQFSTGNMAPCSTCLLDVLITGSGIVTRTTEQASFEMVFRFLYNL